VRELDGILARRYGPLARVDHVVRLEHAVSTAVGRLAQNADADLDERSARSGLGIAQALTVGGKLFGRTVTAL
jgi:hypothetical protein